MALVTRNGRFINCGTAIKIGNGVDLDSQGDVIDSCKVGFDIAERANANIAEAVISRTETGILNRGGKLEERKQPEPRSTSQIGWTRKYTLPVVGFLVLTWGVFADSIANFQFLGWLK